jgi:hypothetical protein
MDYLLGFFVVAPVHFYTPPVPKKDLDFPNKQIIFLTNGHSMPILLI